MAKVYLVGFMGVGKSTIGKKLGELLGYKTLDLDDAFEEKYKITIKSFFQKYDETLFRILESRILDTSFDMDNVIISSGGGTPCFHNNINKMNANGITVYLKMSIPSLVDRLQNAKRPRPLLPDKQADSLKKFTALKLKERSPDYERAHITIEAENIDYDVLVEKIKKEINHVL